MIIIAVIINDNIMKCILSIIFTLILHFSHSQEIKIGQYSTYFDYNESKVINQYTHFYFGLGTLEYTVKPYAEFTVFKGKPLDEVRKKARDFYEGSLADYEFREDRIGPRYLNRHYKYAFYTVDVEGNKVYRGEAILDDPDNYVHIVFSADSEVMLQLGFNQIMASLEFDNHWQCDQH